MYCYLPINACGGCDLFQITRHTIYDWAKHGILRPHKNDQGFTSYGMELRGYWQINIYALYY